MQRRPIARLSSEAVNRIERVLYRALHSKDFADLLRANPEEALRATNLIESERKIVGRLRRDELEENGVDIRPFLSVLSEDGRKFFPRLVRKQAELPCVR
jgi:hypothetical protein